MPRCTQLFGSSRCTGFATGGTGYCDRCLFNVKQQEKKDAQLAQALQRRYDEEVRKRVQAQNDQCRKQQKKDAQLARDLQRKFDEETRRQKGAAEPSDAEKFNRIFAEVTGVPKSQATKPSGAKEFDRHFVETAVEVPEPRPGGWPSPRELPADWNVWADSNTGADFNHHFAETCKGEVREVTGYNDDGGPLLVAKPKQPVYYYMLPPDQHDLITFH